MIIKKEWRILTVGDGDLSFSYSLHKQLQPSALTATIYDSLETMITKYRENAYNKLNKENVSLLFDFDVTNPNSWSALKKQSFDVVIFQFPLLPAFSSFDDYTAQSKNISINTLNRSLLRSFLKNSFKYFLDPQGQQLCFITSKDVTPYKEWNIEGALHQQTDFYYLGSSLFDINNFPHYKVRNVDRDKHVRDTHGRTYVWSLQKEHSLKKQLEPALYQGNNCCKLCRAGPFSTEKDQKKHNASNKHHKMLNFEALWANYISE